MPKFDSIYVTVPLASSYNGSYCSFRSTEINLQLPLTAGEHKITTAWVDVGKLHGKQDAVLQARVTLWYKYNACENTIILCSNDLESKDSMLLTIALKGTPARCVQYTYAEGIRQYLENGNWNTYLDLDTGSQASLYETIKRVNAIIIEAANRLDLNVIELSPLPSKKGFNEFKVVYHKGIFFELYDPGKIYSEDHSIVHIDSVFQGCGSFSWNQPLANVSGSTHDPKPIDPQKAGNTRYSSWMDLWRAYWQNDPPACSSYNLFGFKCTGGLVGGHVYKGFQWGRNYAVVPAGADYVYIIPICRGHNADYHVQMMPFTNQHAIALANYLKK